MQIRTCRTVLHLQPQSLKQLVSEYSVRKNLTCRKFSVNEGYLLSGIKSSSAVDVNKAVNKVTERLNKEDTDISTADTRTGNSLVCQELVRKHEYESYLCTLLVPNVDIRSFVFAVRSFNVEIALIRDQISQKDIGLGRLTFWRDAINKLFQNRANSSILPRHPVVLELNRVLMKKSVSKKWFINLMDARETVMTDNAFKDLNDLEAYCDKSVSSIFYLGFEALGIKNVDADHAASHLGKSIGLTNFIRSVPFNSQRRRVLLPQELLIKHKLSQENLIRFQNQERIQDAIFEIASQAHTHYQKANSMKSSIPKSALPLMLLGTPTDIYLKRLRNSNFNPYDASLNQRYGLLPLHLYYRKLIRSYF